MHGDISKEGVDMGGGVVKQAANQIFSVRAIFAGRA